VVGKGSVPVGGRGDMPWGGGGWGVEFCGVETLNKVEAGGTTNNNLSNLKTGANVKLNNPVILSWIGC
jgi:hypothetical protein